MDLIMRQYGYERLVPYNYEFNVGTDDACDFDVEVPLDQDAWDYFYLDDLRGEYAGYVTERYTYTNEKKMILKGKTLRHYLRSSVCSWVGDTQITIPGGNLGDVITSIMQTYYEGPSAFYRVEGATSSIVSPFTLNRFDSVEQAIEKALAATTDSDLVYSPFHYAEPNEDPQIGIYIGIRKTVSARVDDGQVGGRGQATLSEVEGRSVGVIAAGSGEAAERIIRTVWWDGSAWQIKTDGTPPGQGIEIYFLDYPNAGETELVNKAKSIVAQFMNGSVDLSASELEFDRDANIGDIVDVSGAIDYSAYISGKNLRRVNMYETEEYTYSSNTPISARTSSGNAGANVEVLTVNQLLNVNGDVIIGGTLSAGIEEAEITKVGSVWTSGEIKASKCGGIVTLFFYGATLSATTAYATIAKLPPGFYPKVRTYINTTDITVTVREDGAIRFPAQSGGAYYMTISYVAAQ